MVNQSSIFKKTLVIIIILFFINTCSTSSIAFFQTEFENNDSNKSPNLIKFILKKRFDLGWREFLSIGRYFYRQLRPPVAIQAYPDAVDLRYLNKTVFQIGGKNNVTGEWEPMVKVANGWDWAWWGPKTIFSFEFISSEGISKDVWNVQFDPEQLIMDTYMDTLDWPGAEDPFRTNVTIMLKPSVDPTYPTQDVVLKFNVIRTLTLNHIRMISGSPKWVRTHKQEYIEKQKKLYPNKTPYWVDPAAKFLYNHFTKWFFLLINLREPSFERRIDSTVEILIRVNKYHQVDIIPPESVEIEPYEVKSIPVTIRNIGSHIDTFNFRVSTDEKNMLVTPPPALTLKPGEEVEALVGVAAPKRFLSIGSMSSIFLEAYSVDDPDNVFPQTITLSTVGIHATGGPTYNFALMLIFLFIVVAITIYLIRRRRERIIKKPEKPWEILEEKKYLETLELKDKKKFNEIIDMMKSEYRSALLWHKYYCDSIIRKRKSSDKKIKIINGLKSFLSRLEKSFEKIKKAGKEKLKLKEKKIVNKKKIIVPKKEEVKVEKIVKEPEKFKKVKLKGIKFKKKIFNRQVNFEHRKKNRVINRIRRDQDKQIKIIGKTLNSFYKRSKMIKNINK